MKTILTTAQVFAQPRKQMVDALKHAIPNEGIDEIVIFISDDRRNPRQLDEHPTEEALHWKTERMIEELKELCSVRLIFNNKKSGDPLCSGLRTFHTQIPSKAVNPTLGQPQKLPNTSSFILNGTKIRFLSVPSDPAKKRTIVTTGAITKPFYAHHTSQGSKAYEQHQYGFILVTSYEDGSFSQKPVYCNEKGQFQIKSLEYSPSGFKKKRLEAMSLGDVHLWTADGAALDESFKQIDALEPRHVFFHDLFDGASINNHGVGSLFESIADVPTLKEELIHCYEFLDWCCNDYPHIQFHIVKSNHDDRIERWIDAGHWVKDKANASLCHKILGGVMSGKTGLESGLRVVGGKLPDNLTFHSIDSEMRVKGYKVTDHGHKGVNGSRGTPNSYEKNNHKSITGHTHSPSLTHTCAVTGHLTDVAKQTYALGGLSSWLQANVGITCRGQRVMMVLKSQFENGE